LRKEERKKEFIDSLDCLFNNSLDSNSFWEIWQQPATTNRRRTQSVLLPTNRDDYEVICEDCYVSQRDQWELERFKLTDYHDILICSLCEGTPSRFDDDFECNICFKCTKSHFLTMNEIMAASIGKLPQFDLPTEIIEGSVYLGSHQASVSDDCFTNANITHILVCSTHLPQHHNQSDQFRYHRLPIHDSVTEILSANLFMNACQFIDDALLKKEAVLIHCHAGVSKCDHYDCMVNEVEEMVF
jgi:hypothetical protein